ncbi:MAG: transposase [Pedobacter sp.]
MAKEEHYYTKFESRRFYHVYNRTIDKKKMFVDEGNYVYFLKKFSFYLNELIEVYAYCLLDNHFHFLIRIKENTALDLHEIVSKQFRLLFQSYALAFNKQQNRIGTLFQTPFKRALVTEQQHLFHLIYYIHHNPKKHQLMNNFTDWKWSSYKAMLSDYNTKLKRLEVLNWFGGTDEFIDFHFREPDNFVFDDF